MKRIVYFLTVIAMIILMAGCAAPPVITVISQDGARRQVATIPTSVSKGEVVHIRSGRAEYFISSDVPTLIVGDKVAFQITPLPTPGSLYPAYEVLIENMNTTTASVIMWEDRLGWGGVYVGAFTSFLVGYIDRNGHDHPLRIRPGRSKKVKIYLDPEYECRVKIKLDHRTYPYYLSFRVAPPALRDTTSRSQQDTTSQSSVSPATSGSSIFPSMGVSPSDTARLRGVGAGASSLPATIP